MLILKQVRKEHGLSLAKLSELSGVPQRTIEDAEARKSCKIETAAKLAKAMNTTIDSLWQYEE